MASRYTFVYFQDKNIGSFTRDYAISSSKSSSLKPLIMTTTL